VARANKADAALLETRSGRGAWVCSKKRPTVPPRYSYVGNGRDYRSNEPERGFMDQKQFGLHVLALLVELESDQAKVLEAICGGPTLDFGR